MIEREIRKEFWHLAARPIHDTADIAVETRLVINNAVARGSLSQAHTLLERMKSLYNWALGTQAYGLTAAQVAEITDACRGIDWEQTSASAPPERRRVATVMGRDWRTGISVETAVPVARSDRRETVRHFKRVVARVPP